MFFSLHRWLLRRPGTVVVLALLTLMPMGRWSYELFGDLRADMTELLPQSAKSVLTLRELERRFGGFSQLSLVVSSPDPAANRRFSDELVKEILKLPQIRSARNKLGPEKEFFQKRWQLFIDLEDIKKVEERIDEAATQARERANPLLVDLDDDTKEPIALDFKDFEEKYAKKIELATQFPDDYFESKDKKDLAVIVRRRGLAFGIEDNRRLIDQVGALVEKLDTKKYHAELKVGIGGDVRNVVDEHQSLVEDLVLATSIVLGLMGLLVVGYYRRLRSLYLLGVPLVIGTAWTFGISHFLIGYLNASSGFLGAIVPGNGINFGLIMLARYIEERRAGVGIEKAVDDAVRYTWSATSTVAIAASIAYGSLVATDFLGFKHFGIIGGIGMVLCWASTFLVMPSLLLWVERRWPLDTSKEASHLLPPGTLASIPARFVTAAPRVIGLIGIATGVVSFVVIALFLRDPFEKDFTKLRSRVSLEKGGSADVEAKIDQIFGRYLAPQVILADRPEDVPHIVGALEKSIREGGERAPIVEVTSLASMVPGQQKEKLEVLQRIRAHLSDEVIEQLDDEQKKLALQHRPPADLAPFTAADLPPMIREDFRELDGREGLVILALPNLKLNLYHADEIVRVGDVLREIKLPDGRVVESSGNFVIYSDMLAAVREDGPKATALSLFGVILLCALVFRRPMRVAIVTGALLIGVGWLGALLALLDIKINFLNFIALPITFGIGVDYAVNIFSRNLLERKNHPPEDAAARTVIATGGAVVLCSLTTVIGYGSLLIARNGALISFGQVAILGELTCLVAAMIVLPAWLIRTRDHEDPPGYTQRDG